MSSIAQEPSGHRVAGWCKAFYKLTVPQVLPTETQRLLVLLNCVPTLVEVWIGVQRAPTDVQILVSGNLGLYIISNAWIALETELAIGSVQGDGPDCSVLAVEHKDLTSSPQYLCSLNARGIRDRQSPQNSAASHSNQLVSTRFSARSCLKRQAGKP